MKKLNIILTVILAIYISGCESGSSKLPAYSCSFECLASTPVVSTNTISSATGGTVIVDVEVTGDVTNINDIAVLLQNVDLSSYIVTRILSAPLTNANSISLDVPAGTAKGTYYPQIAFNISNPSPGQSWYNFYQNYSTTNYSYHERTTSGETLMVSPFAVPLIVVN